MSQDCDCGCTATLDKTIEVLKYALSGVDPAGWCYFEDEGWTREEYETAFTNACWLTRRFEEGIRDEANRHS